MELSRMFLQVSRLSARPDVFTAAAPAKRVLGRKMERRCTSEIDYLKFGLERHGFERWRHPGDEVLTGYLDRFRPDRRKLLTFFEFRCCLGALVETIVLLDRFLFLLESDDVVSEAALVQCFDPVVSPRCYALIGLS